ncbi:hypothetical protein CVT26_002304 [Gymnopilus dilepis]|uniref:Plus3 domain-containing protein n=1 Tax=Gymnopilus dilepis TaxID=231916 RepID=A0A409WEC5_9AGAR|nr:hypothetical protein CVT26_002304 [Gymnopilus dilepis]
MSDFEDDIGEQLLELAGATERKKKKRQGSGGTGASGGSGGVKKRKAERMDSDSDSSIESEDEVVDPYPLEGKYKDEADKRELLSLTEFQREQILEERAGERQSILNARTLANLVRQQQRGAAVNVEDSVSRAAKRQHTARGSTKEKTHKLDELRAKRKAKDDRKRAKGSSPSQRADRDSSPQDMDISDSESEDGQISRTEQEEERLLGLTGGSWGGSGGGWGKGRREGRGDGGSVREEDETPCTMADLESVRLSRDAIAKHCVKPWFEDYVAGAWVRYLIGQEPNGAPVYRICQVQNLAPDLVKPYKVNDKTLNQAFELKHGKSVKTFNMDKVSNAPFLDKEFERLQKVCSAEDVKLPTKEALQRRAAEMKALVERPMTESDITAMLIRKNQLMGNRNTGLTTLERSTLNQKRTLALRRHDFTEVAEIDAKLAEDAALAAEQQSLDRAKGRQDSHADMLAKVNERNRKANLEAVRKAELMEAERKRRERRAAMAGNGTPVPSDPSARLKVTPRTFIATPNATRPSTPIVNETVAKANADAAGKAPVKTASSLETSLIDSIEVDLGDF